MSEESVSGGASDPLLLSVSQQGAHTPSFLQQIFQCVCVAGLAMASYFVISHFVLQSVQVVGVSMVPTLHHSQHYLLNRWVYYVRTPKRCDVVVLRDPIDKSFAVKRIIGTAGDHLVFKNGGVYVNGQKLAEPYLAPGMPTFTCSDKNEESFTLSKDQYFVLGDNRRNSSDSRSYGPVPRQNILGLIVR